MMKQYDYIIVGAGLSGSILTYLLSQSRFLKKKKILLIDQYTFSERPYKSSWSYWTKDKNPFSHLSENTWDKISIAHDTFYKKYDLSEYHFEYIKGDSFFQYINDYIKKSDMIDFRVGNVTHIESIDTQGVVALDTGETFSADWVFTSIVNESPKRPIFRGSSFELSLDRPVLDVHEVSFYDARTLPLGSFLYILPTSSHNAHIDVVSLTGSEISFSKVEEYFLKVHNATIRKHEVNHQEVIQYVSNPKERLYGKICTIGLAAGLLNPLSGFAFQNILKDSYALQRSLELDDYPRGLENNTFLVNMISPLIVSRFQRRKALFQKLIVLLFTEAKKKDDVLGFLNGDNSVFKNISLLKKIHPKVFF